MIIMELEVKTRATCTAYDFKKNNMNSARDWRKYEENRNIGKGSTEHGI
jgi:hypothetical protein